MREHFDGMYLSHDAAKGVIETYGMERVSMVLSNTVQLQDWDGRYSRRNKEWAKTIPNDNPETVRCGYALNSHPDAFCLALHGADLHIRSGAWSAQHGNCSAWRGCAYYLFPAEWCDFAGYGIFD